MGGCRYFTDKTGTRHFPVVLERTSNEAQIGFGATV